MPVYVCRIISGDGQRLKIVREAESEEALVRDLNREEIYPLRVTEESGSSHSLRSNRRFSRKAVQEFADTLAVLLRSGLTLRDSLDMIQATFPLGEVNTIAVLLLESVSKGRTISQAVSLLSKRLPPILSGFVRIGEKTGAMSDAISQLASFLTEQAKIRTKLQNSLMYPAFILVVAVAGISGIMLFVFPRIRIMFEELGTGLPDNMMVMMRVIDGTIIGLVVAITAAVLLLITLRIAARRSSTAAEQMGRFVLNIPLIGKYTALKEQVNFLFAMESLVTGGFTVEESLGEAALVVRNPALSSAAVDVRERITRGENLARSFMGNAVFSKRIGRWCAIGERTGGVDHVFSQLRVYFQAELDRWNARIMNLVEPVLILLIGIVVFAIALFLIVPMFSLYQNLY